MPRQLRARAVTSRRIVEQQTSHSQQDNEPDSAEDNTDDKDDDDDDDDDVVDDDDDVDDDADDSDADKEIEATIGKRNHKRKKKTSPNVNSMTKIRKHTRSSEAKTKTKSIPRVVDNVSSDNDATDASNSQSEGEQEEIPAEALPKTISNTALHAQLLTPTSDARKGEEGTLMFDNLALKVDHIRRPLWVLPTGQILLESFSRFYREACDFLVTIAEPVSRPTFIHEYKLTPYSLYAAVSTDIDTEAIVQVLDKLSKVSLPPNVVRFIRECTASYGKAKLVLKKGCTYVESPHVDVLQLLLDSPVIAAARIYGNRGGSVSVPLGNSSTATATAQGFIVSEAAENKTDNIHRYVGLNLEDDDADDDKEQELKDIDDMRRLSRATPDNDGAVVAAASINSDGGDGDGDDDDADNVNTSSYQVRRGMTKQQIEWERLRRREQQDVERAAREWGALVKASQQEQEDQQTLSSVGIGAISSTGARMQGANSQPNTQAPSPVSLPNSTTPTLVNVANNTTTSNTNANASSSVQPQQSNTSATTLKKKKQVFSFQVKQHAVEDVRRTALEMDYPLMEEYDFRRDTVNLPIPIELKPSTHIRSYQARSLSKMFGNGRARSGVIVLPCGAGKTLTGITACATISRSCVVLCNSGVAAQQWRAQLLQFTTIPTDRIARFTSKNKDHMHKDGCILLTTYHMMAKSGRRSVSAQAALRVIESREWGLLILDEVHIAPARLFRQVLMSMKAHCKLGLTATLVREDDKIFDLNFLIGPKLYEANWLDLTDEGYLARVMCREVWCKMPSSFYAEYLHYGDHHHLQQLLYVLNPNKILAVEHLVQQHDLRGDKTLVFCDNVLALRFYQHRLRCPLIFGGTSESDRMRLLSQFRRSSVSNTLLISKVGDVALDLPEANVLIQVSSHYGSRRQEAQRLGRILRRKAGSQYRGGFNAFFYSLVSTDTHEMYYSGKRQQYLVDQGYYFEAVSNIGEIVSATGTANADGGVGARRGNMTSLRDKEEQLKLLREILMSYSARASERDKQKEEQHVAKVRRLEIAEAKAACDPMEKEDEGELAERWMAEEMAVEREQHEQDSQSRQVSAETQAQAHGDRQHQALLVRERERARVIALRERMTSHDAVTQEVVAAEESGVGEEEEDARGKRRRTGGVAKVKRTVTSAGGMASLSGVGDMEYLEYSTNQ